jgi:hypothetical protein
VTVDFNYTTGSGLLNSISGQGAIIDYTHDEHQLLKKVSIVTGGTGDEMLEWEYEYVPANATPPAPQHDAPFNLSKVTSPTGQITTYGYDIQPFTVCPLINNQPCPSALMDRHSNVVVKTRTVDGVVWDYDYSPGDASNPNPNDITTVTASAGGKTLCTSYEHIGEAATLGVIDANTQLVLNRNLHRRGLLVEKKIYAGECSASGSDLMQTETLEYNKKAYITNLDDYRPYPATRDTRVWVPLLTKKTINRRNDKERVTEYSYFGGDYDKDAYQDNTDHWKGLFFLTNPVKSTKEIVDEQVDKATQLLTSSTFNKAGGLSPSPVLTYKVSEAGWEVIDSGVKFSNFKYFNSANGNLDATLDHGVITLYEYWTNGDIKKLVTMKKCR